MENIGIDITNAVNGDKKALNRVIVSIDKLVYNLSIKMLWNVEEAKDASQEILIKVITNLSSFKHESSFSTWVYRVASNYLLTYLSKRNALHQLSFEGLSENLKHGSSTFKSYDSNVGEQNLLVQEIKIGCTLGMLQCLDKDQRISYILGDILNFNSAEASLILSISPEAFRKRLSRAREQLFDFMESNCGIAQPQNNCRCKKQIRHCVASKKVNPNKLVFATNGENIELLHKINQAEETVRLFHSNPEYEMPMDKLREIKELFEI